MLPKYHIIIGAMATIILYLALPLTPLQATIIFLSSFLIDVDHYLIYALTKKDWSLKNATKYFHKRRKKWLSMSTDEQKKYKRYIYIFHGIEFWILLLIISIYQPLTLFVLYGFIIHITLDYIEFIHQKQPLLAKFSQLWVYQTNKKKIHFGP